ncbi:MULTISPECIES: hypothetical protein [Olivibacter]|jgi:hypothetical protein|uniref:Outer membrane protein beta-barrel domain-containing protein n=2 Tax=Sphingobacteriaceae TaxID=84566 RepID=F4CB02_SPHS2|nr:MULTISPECIES: hypothetical protein [Olivibacter]MDM8176737.1 hypothetical protein [Olivibacter sp. 47]QEL00554.1 hypothetical protein FKG96_06930 [Olivibacter sp. LS-1]
MKKIFIFFITALASLQVKAQIWEEYSSFYPGVGIHVGTRGLGIEGAYPLSDAFNVRLGASIFPSSKMKLGNRVFEINRSDVTLLADWQPLIGKDSWIARKWIVSAGIGYFFENRYERYVGTRKVADQKKDYGVEWGKLRPYIGTGINGIRLSQRLNMAVNVGYYIPIESTAIKIYEKDPVDIPKLREDLDSFPYNMVPGVNVQVGISYIFFKNSYNKYFQ